MNAPSAAGIYRAMVEEDGMPKLGTAATLLGIRFGKDIIADSKGAVHRPAFRAGEQNGLSCAATINSLPLFTLPVGWGGSNGRTVVWKIEDTDLPTDLIAGDDSLPGCNRHVSIGQRRWIIMTLLVQSRVLVPSGRRLRRTEAIMELRREFETAWKAGADHHFLLDLVRRHERQGMAARQAYQILHELWLDCGFDESEKDSDFQDTLEYVLEKIWYEQPATK